jgi:exoribonuclease-2
VITENALAAYKDRPALIREKSADRITISLLGGESIRVREKDIELVHPGPVKDLAGLEAGIALDSGAVREAWELLLEQGGQTGLEELAELAFGDYSPASAWAAFRLLREGLYFDGSAATITARRREAVEAEEKKREEKQRETRERERFLERLRGYRRDPVPENRLLDDARFIQDVEALAYGKSPKSKTMRDLDLGETPEDAHTLLLDTGFWTAAVNPYPARFGLSPVSAKCVPGPPPPEERRDLTGLAAFAVDSPWSNDPDDAVSIENAENGRRVLYVHVADPAASIVADSAAEREARDRGATLYLPEGASRMLAGESLSLFALGLAETSPALTFKIVIDEDGAIVDTDIFPSMVKVKRLTYEEADRLADGNAPETAALRDLCALADKNLRRRAAGGAVNIDLPEIHIAVSRGQVTIEPITPYHSADMVRECMLIAGAGAASWAAGQGLPFPYATQEAGELPEEIPPGMAGSYRLRRCMRPRSLSIHPGRHWGLGIDAYTQVTSPLRRYSDLLAHLQIRALLRGGHPLSADEVSARLGAGEAAAAATVQAERASRLHWTMVYLSDKKDSVWDAVALEPKGNRWALIIPALALETQVSLRDDPAPNDLTRLTLKSVSIPRREAVFICGGV